MTHIQLQTLADIFRQFPFDYEGKFVDSDVRITGVQYDSRDVEQGNIFVAIAGEYADGHDYIDDAIEKGAVAIVGTRRLEALAVPYIRVEAARPALAHLAAAFYHYPARKLVMIGVTGTDGKTTTTNLIFNILLSAGIPAGMISTVNAIIGDEVIDTGFHVTTPEAPEIQRYLYQMLEAGLTHVVLEATSHGLAQHRVTACDFDIAVVTNITHEHLDYHGSYESYWEAKGMLFFGLSLTSEKPFGNPGLAVLNQDDASYAFLREKSGQNIATYGILNAPMVKAENIAPSPAGLRFDVLLGGQLYPFHCQLIGKHNVSNCLAAISAAYHGLHICPQSIQKGIHRVAGIPGRMEVIDCRQNFLAIVDFAHTPNALRSALQAARNLTAGRVIAVFGSAGLRDKEKRRLMAQESIALADVTYLTAEDPRTEALEEILAEMSAAAQSAGGRIGEDYWCVPDRGEAILAAVSQAEEGDVVIVCGKGHEQSMCFGETEYPWDDRIAMRAALSKLLGLEGPGMPYLPTQAE